MTCLVLLPGMDGTGSLFSDFAATLGDGIKTVVIAYPATQALGYAQLETLVRDQLPRDEPYVLLGESFSGPIAISIAANAAPNMASIILSCSFAANPRPSLACLNPFIPLLPGLRSTALISPLLLGASATPRLKRQLATALTTVSPNVIRARLRAILGVDVTEKLRRVRVPLLYLRATHDRLVPEQAGQLITACAPRARIEAIQGPHMLLQAAPSAAADVVSKFMSNELG